MVSCKIAKACTLTYMESGVLPEVISFVWPYGQEKLRAYHVHLPIIIARFSRASLESLHLSRSQCPSAATIFSTTSDTGSKSSTSTESNGSSDILNNPAVHVQANEVCTSFLPMSLARSHHCLQHPRICTVSDVLRSLSRNAIIRLPCHSATASTAISSTHVIAEPTHLVLNILQLHRLPSHLPLLVISPSTHAPSHFQIQLHAS